MNYQDTSCEEIDSPLSQDSNYQAALKDNEISNRITERGTRKLNVSNYLNDSNDDSSFRHSKEVECNEAEHSLDDVKQVVLFGERIVSLSIDGRDRLCLAQISSTLLKEFSYNEIHNRRVALGITCVQCTPIQLEMLRRVGAMPSSSRRCGMITIREAERLCRSFLVEEHPPDLPENFYFTIAHKINYGCKGRFVPARYVSSRAKCIECFHCGDYYSPNKFIFHSHKQPNLKEQQCNPPDSPNINSWRKHIDLDPSQEHSQEIKYAWEDVKSLFNGGTRRRMPGPSSATTSSKPSNQVLLLHSNANVPETNDLQGTSKRLKLCYDSEKDIDDHEIVDVECAADELEPTCLESKNIKHQANFKEKTSISNNANIISYALNQGNNNQSMPNSSKVKHRYNQTQERSSINTTVFKNSHRPIDHDVTFLQSSSARHNTMRHTFDRYPNQELMTKSNNIIVNNETTNNVDTSSVALYSQLCNRLLFNTQSNHHHSSSHTPSVDLEAQINLRNQIWSNLMFTNLQKHQLSTSPVYRIGPPTFQTDPNFSCSSGVQAAINSDNQASSSNNLQNLMHPTPEQKQHQNFSSFDNLNSQIPLLNHFVFNPFAANQKTIYKTNENQKNVANQFSGLAINEILRQASAELAIKQLTPPGNPSTSSMSSDRGDCMSFEELSHGQSDKTANSIQILSHASTSD